jgi:hypothetical protein
MYGLLIPIAKVHTNLHSAKYLCDKISLTSMIYPCKTDGAKAVADEVDEWTIGIKYSLSWV